MGKQIRFYMDQETELELIEEILKNGKIIYDSITDIQPPIQIDNMQELKQSQDNKINVLYFYRPEYGVIVTHVLPDKKIALKSSESPVIEFMKTRVNHDEKEIYPGRLWVEMKYWDAAEEFVDKPEELAKWYASLVKWIKQHSEKVDVPAPVNYWTPAIRDLQRQGYTVCSE